MDIENLKIELEDLFEQDKLKKMFEILKTRLDRKSNRYSLFLNLKRRYGKLQDGIMMQTVGRDNANTEGNLIGESLLKFIHSLEQGDFNLQDEVVDEVSNISIVVLTHHQHVTELEDFFNLLDYTNLVVWEYDKVKFNDIGSDILIFDNRDLPDCPKEFLFEKLEEKKQQLIQRRIEMMNQVLAKKDPLRYIIHVGNFLFWINNNREQVQAANSKFSLHARTKEVIDFINTYRV